MGDPDSVIRGWHHRLGEGTSEPRRLVWALPQDAGVDEVADQIRGLSLPGDIALHVVMGVREEGDGDWREDMHRPAIIVGNVDTLLSRALNRGHDIGRVIQPIDFALLTNGAHWVVADGGRCPQSTATLARLAELAQAYGTAEPFRLTVLSPPAEPGEASALSDCDFLDLFDGDADVDIAPFISDSGDLYAQVARAAWTPGEDGAPDPEIQPPPAGHRHRVPVGEIVRMARERPVWRFDPEAEEWTRLTAPDRPRPAEVLLVRDADGLLLRTPAELATLAEAGEPALAEPRPWQSLDEHSEQVRDQAEALLAVLSPDLPPGAARSTVIAGYLHDAGKAHEIWQDALCALAPGEDSARVMAGRPWAKSGITGRLEFAGEVSFRHELASLLLIDGPLNHLLTEAPDPDLTRYLVLAHHGQLRVQVRDPDVPDGPAIRGLRHGATSDVPAMLGCPATTLTVGLDQFHGGDWTRTVLSLRDRYGPFILSYLETIVRIADWRASGARELPCAGSHGAGGR